MNSKYTSQQLLILDQHFAPKLSKKAFRQMRCAVVKPKNEFAEKMLLAQLIADSDGKVLSWLSDADDFDIATIEALKQQKFDDDDLVQRPSYMCLSASARIAGRSQSVTLFALENVADDTSMTFSEVQSSQAYFTNHMRFWAGEDDVFSGPSKRSVLGPITIFTLEFDPPDEWNEDAKLSVFEAQLGWLRRSGDTKASQEIQSFISWLKGFSDYRGICVTYSGSKSLHFHIAFDTADLCASDPKLRDEYRPAYAVAHDAIAEKFTSLLPLNGLLPDRGMREPERFRRLPNGTRTVSEGTPHLFGVPPGRDVMQSVLFEEVLSKAPKGADKRLLDAIKLKQHAKSIKRREAKRSAPSSVGTWRSDGEHAHWVKQANLMLAQHSDADGFPKVSHFEMWGDGVLMKLYASPGDRNPGGVWFENSNRPVFTGSGKQPAKHISIGLPLSFYIQRWQRDWRKLKPDESGKVQPLTTTTPITDSAVEVNDIDAARADFEAEILKLADSKNTVMFKGPTGFGKTFTTMKLMPDLVLRWRDRAMRIKESAASFEREHIGLYRSAVATISYEQAKEKCDEFNNMHSDHVAVGVLFQSFDQLYSKALVSIYGDQAGNHRITTDTASTSDQRSVTSAIRSMQPDVWAFMEQLHADMLRPLLDAPSGSVAVLFMVHDVLHQWTEGGLSRLLSHHDFFATDTEQLWTRRDATQLVVAVQDEVSDAHFLLLEQLQTVAWCERLFADNEGIWSEQFIHLSKARSHWERFCRRDATCTISFETALRVRRLQLSTENIVGVGPIEPYCHDADEPAWKIYAETHTSSYVHQQRNWWDGLAQHTFILTTEHLPMVMFQSATRNQENVAVYDIKTGVHPDGVVDIHTLNILPASANQELAMTIREDDKNLFIIANKVQDLDRALSPVAAKGVNFLATENILQIMNVVSPSEYARMQVINLLYEMRNALRLRHIDQFNQTAGRNLGCRYKGRRHLAYMPRLLWAHLTSGPLTEFAFAMNLIETAEQRRDQRSNASRQIDIRLAKDDEELRYYESYMPHDPTDQAIDLWAADMGIDDQDDKQPVDLSSLDWLLDQLTLEQEVA